MKLHVPVSFLRLAREMRDLQKRFFAGDRSVVGRAKGAEKEFDHFLASVDSQITPGLDLFDEANGYEADDGVEVPVAVGSVQHVLELLAKVCRQACPMLPGYETTRKRLLNLATASEKESARLSQAVEEDVKGGST